MGKMKILVVEDEHIVAKDIQRSLEKLGFEVVGIASSGEKALEIAKNNVPDLALMDIEIQGDMNGIETAEIMKERFGVPVIYLTAYADEATLKRARVTEPYGYILKPFKEIDLHTSIEMAIYKHGRDAEVLKERDYLYNVVEGKSSGEILFVKSNSRLVKLKASEIYFVEALKDYVVINTLNHRYTIHSTMKEIESKLSDNDFIRVHRSYIVRVDKIASVEQPNIVMEDGKKVIPIGGSYKDDFAQKLNLI